MDLAAADPAAEDEGAPTPKRARREAQGGAAGLLELARREKQKEMLTKAEIEATLQGMAIKKGGDEDEKKDEKKGGSGGGGGGGGGKDAAEAPGVAKKSAPRNALPATTTATRSAGRQGGGGGGGRRGRGWGRAAQGVDMVTARASSRSARPAAISRRSRSTSLRCTVDHQAGDRG